jgi:predicted metal-dependent hydrolase
MAGLLKRFSTTTPAPITEEALCAALGDPDLAARIHVRVSAKARRVSLRVDAADGRIVLVHPRRTSAKTVLAFAAAKRDWIIAQLAALPARVAFDDGVAIPLRGTPHVLRFAPEERGGVWREDGVIVVAGRREHAPRRLTDWLKAEARAAIAPLARVMAERLGRRIDRVTVRDTSSRWGSCSRAGALSFSWRLILAPDHVFTYVVAHEVAHLTHMDHSAAFWRTVGQLMPQGAEEAKSARDWLRRHGAVLHGYG